MFRGYTMLTDYELTLIQNIEARQLKVNELINELKTISPHLFTSKKKPSKRFEIPSVQEITDHIKTMGYFVDAEQFHAFYSSKDWMIGKNKMKNWKAALVTWNKKSGYQQSVKQQSSNTFFDSINSQDF